MTINDGSNYGNNGAPLLGFPDTDAGNAEAFALLNHETLRYDHTRGEWKLWNGNHWVDDIKDKTRDAVLETARLRRLQAASISNRTEANKRIEWALQSESTSRITAALKAAESVESFATITSEYDRDSYLFTCGNGTLDLRTGHLRAPRAEDLITCATAVPYLPESTCPRWLRFLDQVFAGDEELISFMWRAVGYCLTGDTTEQCFFILWGEGANGKSTFLQILLQVLGSHAVTTPFSTFLIHYNVGSPRNDIAALYGARFVKAAESQHRASMDEALIKEITGSDTISARFLYAEHFSFVPQFKLWLATNHKPRIKGTDEAIWRRTRLIPFTQRFEGKTKDRHLLKKLKAELPGILAWAVQGCKEWQRSELGMPAAILNATLEYRAESDLVGIFVEEECVVGKQLSVGAKDLYMSYRNWASARNEEVVPSSIFSSDMLQRRFTKTRIGKGVMYHGLALQSRPNYGPSIRPADFKKAV